MIKRFINFYEKISRSMSDFIAGIFLVLVLAAIWIIPIALFGLAIKLIIYIVNL